MPRESRVTLSPLLPGSQFSLSAHQFPLSPPGKEILKGCGLTLTNGASSVLSARTQFENLMIYFSPREPVLSGGRTGGGDRAVAALNLAYGLILVRTYTRLDISDSEGFGTL